MSRWYRMSVTITDYDPAQVDAIFAAAKEEWAFERLEVQSTDAGGGLPCIWGDGESNLCGGKSEEEFALRLTRGIWRANGQFREVTVDAVYLEELPTDSYAYDLTDYQTFLTEGATKPSKNEEQTP